MITRKKLFLVLLGTFLFISLILFMIFVFPFIGMSNMCANRIISSTPINGTNYQIVIFERDCGATTDFSTQASILEDNDELPNECGNIIISDTDHGKAPSGVGGGPEVRVKVVAKDTIELSCHYRTRILFKEIQYNNINIKYSTFGAS